MVDYEFYESLEEDEREYDRRQQDISGAYNKGFDEGALAYLKGKKLICKKCVDCPLGRCHNGKALHCNELEAEFPEMAIEIVLRCLEENNNEREDI